MHLQEIAFHIAPGAHAVLLLDQAGWHGSAELVVPPNITLLPLPPRCPELNPVEILWQFMRDNWLSNRIFKSYDDNSSWCPGYLGDGTAVWRKQDAFALNVVLVSTLIVASGEADPFRIGQVV